MSNNYTDSEDSKYENDITFEKPKVKKNNKIHKRKKRNYSSDDYSSAHDHEFKENTTHNFWSQHEYAQMYTTLKKLEKFGANICVPEFVFFGLQSSGKTSAVSQAARLPVGVMKNGTASRCPTRFKLKYDENQENPLIRVNGMVVKNEEEMIEKVLVHMQKLERQNKFSKNVLEITIDWKNAPELTFVDLPGMITNREDEYKADRIRLEEITAYYLNSMKNGKYQYMPVLVKEAMDKELDTKNVEGVVDRIIKQYNSPEGSSAKRLNWRDDTLFIVNKFDKLINVGKAKDLVKRMNEYNMHGGRTVITMLNPREEMTGNMEYAELKRFVARVPDGEKGKWEEIFANFHSDDNISALKQKCSELCGVSKMNDIINVRMKEIVKRILPDIERVLNQTEVNKNRELQKIAKQISNCDPIRLKTAVTKFNNRFLNYMRNFYVGNLAQKLKDVPSLANSRRLTWAEELQQFHMFSDVFNMADKTDKTAIHVKNWCKKGYERSANMMLELLKRSTDSHGKDFLSSAITMKLMGGPSMARILDVWAAMVAFMPFPKYTDEDVHNSKHNFDDTKQASMWSSIRALVLDSVEHFVDACHWLAEMTRFRLKRNADLIFEYTIIEEFGSNNSAYGGITDVALNRKMNNISMNDNDIEEEDEDDDDDDPEETVNGKPPKLTKKMVEDIQEIKMQGESSIIDSHMRRLLERGLKSYKKVIDQIVDEFCGISEVVPPDHAQILDKMFCEYNINLGSFLNYVLQKNAHRLEYNNDERRLKLRRGHNRYNEEVIRFGQILITEPTKENMKKADIEIKSDDDKIPEDEFQTGIDFPNQQSDNIWSVNKYDDDIHNKNGIFWNSENDQSAYSAVPVDINYYRNIHGRSINHAIAFNDMQFNCSTIRSLTHAFWIGIKHMCSRDIQQKFSHRIMSVIKQQKWKNDRILNAVQCGVERKDLEDCMEQLMKLTGIARSMVEDLVSKAPIVIPKDIAQMKGDELSAMYGVNRAHLLLLQQDKLDELSTFVELKNITLIQITQIQQS